MKIEILIPNQATEIREVEKPTNFEEIKAMLTEWFPDTMFEHVTIMLPDGERSDMFVDEVGQLKHLPRNSRATEHYLRASKKAKRPIGLSDYIVGPAIVCHERIWF